MHQGYRRKPSRGRSVRYASINNSDTKNSFRNQDNFTGDKGKISDVTLYNIARFLMGNEVQIVTKNIRIEGVLRSFDSSNVSLSKVIVYDFSTNENIPLMRELQELKEVGWRDILMIKVIGTNGKSESVLVDHEISQRKQMNRIVQSDDKNLVPYFDDNDTQMHNDKDDNDLGITMMGDQCCWYNPEEMIKLNAEKFNIKSTFDDNMEGYTTKIDRSDPLLHEKYQRAEKLAWEIENDTSLRQSDDEGGDQDEELRYSAVTANVVSQEASVVPPVPPTVKLNPNAPEFRPRPKVEHEHVDEGTMVAMPDPFQQQQQQQQHQQMIMRMAQHMQVTPQAPQAMAHVAPQPYPGQRLVGAGPQWTTVSLPHQSHQAPPGQYLLQQYIPHQGPLMQPVYQTRQMPAAGPMDGGPGPTGVVFYSPGQFFVQPSSGEHMPGLELGPQQPQPHGLYGTMVDVSGGAGVGLRQPHLVPMHQGHPAAAPQAQQPPAPGQGHYYAAAHQTIATGHPNFPQILFNQQTQLQSGPSIQNYIANGRP